MTCVNCSADLSALTPIRSLVTCPTCLRTVIAATGAFATSAETVNLSPADLAALKAQRKVARAALVPAEGA